MRQYLELMDHVMRHGRLRGDRTGTGTRGVFGRQLRFDLREGFPLMTTKRIPFRWVAEELLWFLSGSTNERDLSAKGADIWKEWATAEQCARFDREPGDLGPVYGHQWRNFGATNTSHGIDQIASVVEQIKRDQWSRRLIVTAWNPNETDQVTLPPCHCFFQFHVQDGELSCQLYQRSADIFLGVPFNIASYALLTHMVAHVTGLEVGEFVYTLGDAHLYLNHVDAACERLTRSERSLPVVELNPEALDIFAFRYEDFTLHGYHPCPPIRAEVSV